MSKKQQTPSYRLHKPSGRAVVTLDGKDFYVGPYGTKTSRYEYDRLIAEWLANGRRLPTAERPAELTVNELILRYWRFAQGYYRKNGEPTVEISKIKVIMRWLQQLYGLTPVSEFGPLALKTIRQSMIAAGHSRGYINEQIARIKRAFKWGVENELVHSTVYPALQAVAGLRRGCSSARETDPVRPVPEEHITAVRPFVSKEVSAMIQLQLLTGMRPGEVRLMRGFEIDFTGNVWTYLPLTHKTEHHGRDRTVYLGPAAQQAIKPFLARDTTAFLFSPHHAMKTRHQELRRRRKTPVQPSQRNRTKAHPKWSPGGHYCREAYRKAIQRACRKAGVPSWTPAQLRHNAATRYRKEYGLEVAQIILGHQSAEVTQIYAERDTARAMAVVAKIG